MANKINTDYIVEKASAAAEEVGEHMAKVHGQLWDGRENLSKLIVSLSSAMLVGTITFSGTLLGSGSEPTVCPVLITTSWVLLFLSMVLGLTSLWHSNTLKSFRVRFTNSEPDIIKEASKLDSNKTPEELMPEIVEIVKKYSDASVRPLGSADRLSHYSLMASLLVFGLGVGAFLLFGTMQIT